VDDCFDWLINVDYMGFLLIRHFEGGELALEHFGFHVMVLAGLHSLPDEVETAV
jgi:hypothetical protein